MKKSIIMLAVIIALAVTAAPQAGAAPPPDDDTVNHPYTERVLPQLDLTEVAQNLGYDMQVDEKDHTVTFSKDNDLIISAYSYNDMSSVGVFNGESWRSKLTNISLINEKIEINGLKLDPETIEFLLETLTAHAND